jgi:hypothetical protein
MIASRFLLVCSASSLILYSCSSTSNLPAYEFGNNYYTLRQPGAKPMKVYVDISEDTMKVTPVGTNIATVEPSKSQVFIRPTFDVDILITLFKYRPATEGLPRQLTTDFSGNLFMGYRLDRFKITSVRTPAGSISKRTYHTGVSLGAFGGIGSTAVTPWTTAQGTMDEYTGLVLCRGFALMFGVNRLTVGIGIGRDYLTDRDKSIWIYQNKPWYGLNLSVNIN